MRKSTTGMNMHGDAPAMDVTDETALQDFYWTYVESIYRFIYYRTGKDHHTTEDIVQETFIHAIRSLPQYRSESSVFGWLKGIAVRRIADHFRSRKADMPLSSALNAVDRDYRVLLEQFDRESLSEEDCNREHVRDLVHATMSTIPPMYAKVLGLKYVQGCSVGAIADAIGKSVKAAESILTRARDAFRRTFTVLLEELAAEGG